MLVLGVILLLAQSEQERAAAKEAEHAAQQAVDAFDKEWKIAAEARKVALIGDLGKIHHAKIASRLGGVIGANESSTVRIAAVQALGSFADSKKPAGAVLVKVLPDSLKEPGFFGHVCAAIGELKEPGAAGALSKYFDDKDETVAKITIAAAGKAGCGVSIDPLIAVLAHCERLIKAAINAAGGIVTDPGTGNQFVAKPELRPYYRARALVPVINAALTGISQESLTTSEAWSAWWARNRETFGRK